MRERAGFMGLMKENLPRKPLGQGKLMGEEPSD